MSSFKREDRYIVLKRSDIDSILSQSERNMLNHICNLIRLHRAYVLEKLPLKCVVVEDDWPEYEIVWNMIEKRCEEK